MNEPIRIQSEGFTGEKKVFVSDPWPDIYAAWQNRNSLRGVMQDVVSAVEEYELDGENELCLVVMKDGAKGIIPLKESGIPEPEGEEEYNSRPRLRQLVGRVVAFKVMGIDRDHDLFVASRKAALEEMAQRTWEEIEEGQVKTATVRLVTPYRVIVDIGGIQAVISPNELSWGWVNDPRDVVQVGESFDVKIIQVDRENMKVRASLKELLPNPWERVPQKYRVGNEYLGTVTGVREFARETDGEAINASGSDIFVGVFVELEPGVTVLCPPMRFQQVVPGDKVIVRINRVRPEERRMSGSLVRRIRTA